MDCGGPGLEPVCARCGAGQACTLTSDCALGLGCGQLSTCVSTSSCVFLCCGCPLVCCDLGIFPREPPCDLRQTRHWSRACSTLCRGPNQARPRRSPTPLQCLWVAPCHSLVTRCPESCSLGLARTPPFELPLWSTSPPLGYLWHSTTCSSCPLASPTGLPVRVVSSVAFVSCR